MPLGLRNALSTFQRTIYVILFTVRCQFASVYLGDILIISRSPQEHNSHVRTVLTLLRIAGIIPKLKKNADCSTKESTSMDTLSVLDVLKLCRKRWPLYASCRSQQTSQSSGLSWANATYFENLLPALHALLRH